MGDLHGYALPVVSLDSDDGFGVGARAELYRDREGYEPYLEAWMIHAHVTLTGYQHHRMRYDRLWPHARLTVNLAYRKWQNAGWYGLGDGWRVVDPPNPKFQRYILQQPFGRVTVRHDLTGPLQAFVALDLDVTTIRTHPGESALLDQAPNGMDGGPQLEGLAGLIVDTRQPEISPVRGVFAEVSGRVGARLPMIAPRGSMFGVMALAKGYQQLTPGVVFAGRVMAERLWGDVPFYEMTHWGGSTPIVGMGGAETIRGLNSDRFHAPGHAVANAELRVDAFTLHVRKAPLVAEAVPFVDAGTTWGTDRPERMETCGVCLHPSAGLGLRAVYDEAFVGRLDFAIAPDAVRYEGDLNGVRPTWGFYLAFDHTF